MKLNNCTVIIPTIRRSQLSDTRRRHFEEIGCPVLIASPGETVSTEQLEIPETSFQNRVLLALRKASTEYIVLVPDDDWILHSTLERLLRTMEARIGANYGWGPPEEAVFSGRNMGMVRPLIPKLWQPPSQEECCMDLDLRFWEDYPFTLFWGVYRREYAIKLFTAVSMLDTATYGSIEMYCSVANYFSKSVISSTPVIIRNLAEKSVETKGDAWDRRDHFLDNMREDSARKKVSRAILQAMHSNELLTSVSQQQITEVLRTRVQASKAGTAIRQTRHRSKKAWAKLSEILAPIVVPMRLTTRLLVVRLKGQHEKLAEIKALRVMWYEFRHRN